MRYLGGKSRIAKRIAAHLEALAGPGVLIEDRFCGGLSVAAAIKHRPLRAADAGVHVASGTKRMGAAHDAD